MGAVGWGYLGYENAIVVLIAATVEAPKREGSGRFSVIVGARINNCA